MNVSRGARLINDCYFLFKVCVDQEVYNFLKNLNFEKINKLNNDLTKRFKIKVCVY